MSANTSIEWTDRTWNPVRGCSVISPGCVNCYAMKTAHRFNGPGQPYEGLTKETSSGPQWTGTVRLVPHVLLEPLTWRTPQRIFVNSMSDLFHESLSFADIDQVFAIMALAPQHVFQVLTKRADRLRRYFTEGKPWQRIAARAYEYNQYSAVAAHVFRALDGSWPLPNVWLGVSVEYQQRADERIPLLLETPAAVRFISAEPLLGSVDLANYLWTIPGARLNRLHWVIVGGESGPGARPFDVRWAVDIVRQCKAADVPAFVKQLGAVPIMGEDDWRAIDRRAVPLLSARNHRKAPTGTVPLAFHDRKGGNPAEWPEDLRVREFPR